jgi:hypothetical protein
MLVQKKKHVFSKLGPKLQLQTLPSNMAMFNLKVSQLIWHELNVVGVGVELN